MPTLGNIFWLGTKELRSFMRDYVLLGLVVYSFTLAVIAQAQSSSQGVRNASIAIVDEDHSELSRRIVAAFLPPYFQPPQPIAERDIMPLMNAGRYSFVLDIPPNFERYVLAAANRRSSSMSMRPRWSRPVSGPITHNRLSPPRSPIFCLAPRARPQRRSTSSCASPSTRMSRRRGSPASWASSTMSRCWRSSWPAPRSSASANTARSTICW